MDKLPTQTIKINFNPTDQLFEFWQTYEEFETKHLIMTMTIDDVCEELRKSVVTSLIRLGVIMKQIKMKRLLG